MPPLTLARDSRSPSCSLPLIGRSPLRLPGLSPTRDPGAPSFISASPRYLTILHSLSHIANRDTLLQMHVLKSRTLQFLNAIDHLTNSLQPINLLPPEMVLRISAHLIDEVEYYRPLLVATQISRYWRETILGASSLWTSIDSHHPRLATVCMERSNTAWLTVRLRSNVSLDFISNLQLHTTRIKTLDVSMPPSDFQRILPQLDPHLMRLESLTLDLNSVHPLSFLSFPPLSSLDMSRLKTLNVQNLCFLSTFFCPRNLTKLSIIYSDGQLSVLLSIIAANPHLEEILIVSGISDLSYPSADVIPLPHLRVLNATLPWHAIKTLLRHLSLPSSSKLIVITATQDLGQKEFLPTLLPEKLDHLQNLLRIETLTYHYSQVANHQTLCGSSPSYASRTHPYLKGGSFTFRWTAFTRFDLVFSPLSLTHVRHLQLNLDCVYSFRSAQVELVDRIPCQYVSAHERDLYSEWRGVFRSLNQLERLTVVRLRDLVELVGPLMDHTENPPGPIPHLGVCPYQGQGSERRNKGVSSLHSAVSSPYQRGCETDSLCPSLHTLEFIECHWLCSQLPVLLDFVRRRALFTPSQDPRVLFATSCPSLILHPPPSISPIRRIHIQSSRPSLLPHSQDIKALMELVDAVVAEVQPKKACLSRGVEPRLRPEIGGHWREPPFCAVCGIDLGLS